MMAARLGCRPLDESIFNKCDPLLHDFPVISPVGLLYDLGPQAWALPRTGDAWSRKWTQALMLATSAHCAISSGHPSMRAFQMRRAATDSASGNHRISRPVAVAVKSRRVGGRFYQAAALRLTARRLSTVATVASTSR
jgi:hypothetical protein